MINGKDLNHEELQKFYDLIISGEYEIGIGNVDYYDVINDYLNMNKKDYEEQLKMQGLSLEQYFEFTKTTMADLEKQMHYGKRYIIED